MNNYYSKTKFIYCSASSIQALISILVTLFFSSAAVGAPIYKNANSTPHQSSETNVYDEYSDYRVFVTEKAFSGDFVQEYWWASNKDGQEITVESAADYLCEHDSRNPNINYKYKALVGTAKRYGKPYAQSKDWPLIANKKYYNDYHAFVFTSSAESTFNFESGSFNAVLDMAAETYGWNAWTGLTEEWQTNDHNCKDWAGHNDKEGRVGDLSSKLSNSISDNRSGCGNRKHLICVQQTLPRKDACPNSCSDWLRYNNAGDLKPTGKLCDNETAVIFDVENTGNFCSLTIEYLECQANSYGGNECSKYF